MNQEKKVLIVNEPLQYGGSDIVAVRLQQGLNTEEFDCTYCLRYEEPGPMEPEIAATGVRILHQPDDQLSYRRSYRYYKALFAKEQFNIVHCHLLFTAALCLRRQSGPVSLSVWRMHIFHSRWNMPIRP